MKTRKNHHKDEKRNNDCDYYAPPPFCGKRDAMRMSSAVVGRADRIHCTAPRGK